MLVKTTPAREKIGSRSKITFMARFLFRADKSRNPKKVPIKAKRASEIVSNVKLITTIFFRVGVSIALILPNKNAKMVNAILETVNCII